MFLKLKSCSPISQNTNADKGILLVGIIPSFKKKVELKFIQFLFTILFYQPKKKNNKLTFNFHNPQNENLLLNQVPKYLKFTSSINFNLY